jgi:hypothetical protein
VATFMLRQLYSQYILIRRLGGTESRLLAFAIWKRKGVYRTILLFVVLCGCEMLCFALTEEYKLECLKTGAERNIWTEEGGSNSTLTTASL